MELIDEIKRRAKVLVEDNFEAVKRNMVIADCPPLVNLGNSNAKDHLLTLVETAMCIGTSIAYEKMAKEQVVQEDENWCEHCFRR
jgi:hypothetical protein